MAHCNDHDYHSRPSFAPGSTADEELPSACLRLPFVCRCRRPRPGPNNGQRGKEKINDTFRCLSDQAINQSVNIFISRIKKLHKNRGAQPTNERREAFDRSLMGFWSPCPAKSFSSSCGAPLGGRWFPRPLLLQPLGSGRYCITFSLSSHPSLSLCNKKVGSIRRRRPTPLPKEE